MGNKRIKILAIDDFEDNLTSLKALLNEAFSENIVLTATSGEDGLRIAASEDPDVILLDILMPDMDGYEVCRRLKLDKKLSGIPVVFITALKADRESRILALECGGEAFISKPIDRSELTAQIRAMVKIKSANIEKINEKERLTALVEERTQELKENYTATLNILEDLKNENEARKKSEEARMSGEEKFKLLFANLASGCCIDELIYKDGIAVDYLIIDVNTSYEKILGLTRAEVVGSLASDIYKTNDIPFIEIYARVVETGISETYEAYFPPADKILNITTSCIGEGKFSNNFTDITGQRQARETLLQSESKYKALFENVTDAIFIYNPDTFEILHANESTSRLYGYDKNELIGMSCLKLSAEVEKSKTSASKIINDGLTIVPCRHHKKKDGTDLYVQLTGYKVNANGDDLMFSVIKDITGQKQSEQQLLKYQNLLKETEKTGKIGGWDFDAKTLTQTWTDETFNILEIDITGGEPKVPEGLDFIMPSSRTLAEKAVQRAIEYGEPYDQEWEIITAKGNTRWVHSVARVNQVHGKTVSISGSFQDITQRKKSENDLRENEKILKFVLQGSQLGFWDWNIKTGEVKRNERWAEMLGYNIDDIEFSVRQWSDFVHPDDMSMAWESINNHLEGRTPFYSLEYRMRTKDGSYKWILDQAQAVEWDENRHVVRMSGIHEDITERKLSQQKINSLLSEKELILQEVHHRIKNNMSTIKGLIAMQVSAEKNKLSKISLQDLESRVQSMMMLYEKLYNSQNYSELSVKDYLGPLAVEIINNFPNSNIVNIKTEIDDFILKVTTLPPLGIIINEILTNIMKHAFTGRDSGLITLTASIKENRILIIIQDNGIGIPESITFENSTGFGMQLVSMLTEQIEGSIRIERGPGSKFILEFDV